MTNIKKQTIKLLWFLFFFLMIFMPRQQQIVKVGLMLLIIFAKVLTGRAAFFSGTKNKYVKRFIICWFTAAVLTLLVGVFNSNPGLIETFRLDIFYVAILLILFFSVDSREELDWINKVIFFSGTVCALYTLIWFLVNIGIWPRSLFYAFDVTTNFGQHEGYTHMTNTNGSMLIPILPMCFVSYMTTSRTKKQKYKIIPLGICALAALLSGRRMVWASLPFALVFVIILAIKNPQRVKIYRPGTNKKRLWLILLSILVIGGFVFAKGIINIDSMIERFKAVMAGGEEAGDRTDQAAALIDGFLKHPILGAGAGASAAGSLRNQDFTWAYELSYHAVLFHSGIVGFSLYVFALISIAMGCIAGAKKRNKSYSSYVCLLAGLLMGYIANATNPYFSSSFDFLWWILWPVGFIYVDDKLSRKELDGLLAT